MNAFRSTHTQGITTPSLEHGANCLSPISPPPGSGRLARCLRVAGVGLALVLADLPAALGWNPAPNGSVDSIHPFEDSGYPGLDGKVLVAGGFTRIGGVTRPGLALLNPDGTVDPGFNSTIEPEWAGVSVLEVSGSAIFIGGDFTHVNGAERLGLARLDLNGDLYNLGWTTPVVKPTRILHPVAKSPVYVLAADKVIQFDLESGAVEDEATVGNRKNALIYQTGALYAAGEAGVIKLVKQDGAWESDGDFSAAFNGTVRDLIADPASEGIFVAGGLFSSFNGEPAPHIVEFDATGARNGDLNWPGADPNGLVDLIHYDGIGFVLGGGFTELLPEPRVGLGRIFRGLGLLDETFAPGESIRFYGVPAIHALASTQDHIYVGGFFNVGGDGFRSCLMRLSRATGSLDVTYPTPMAPAAPGPASPEPYPLPLADVWVRTGDDVRLVVPEEDSVRGWPEPTSAQIDWFKDGKAFVGGAIAADRWSTLLSNAQPEDSGVYSVLLRNIVGEGTATFRVNVTEDPRSIPIVIHDPDPAHPELSFVPWQAGLLQPVVWGPATGEPVNIELSTNGGNDWIPLAEGLTDYGRYNLNEDVDSGFAVWNVPVPDELTQQAMLRVRHSEAPGVAAAVAGPFEIGPAYSRGIRGWRQQYFGTEEGSGDSADDADWDQDTFWNLLEYALGSDPTDPASPVADQLPAYSVSVDPAEGLQFNVVFPVSQAPWDLAYVLEESEDLLTWRTYLNSRREMPLFQGWDHHQPVGGATATWYRFRVVRPFP